MCLETLDELWNLRIENPSAIQPSVTHPHHLSFAQESIIKIEDYLTAWQSNFNHRKLIISERERHPPSSLFYLHSPSSKPEFPDTKKSINLRQILVGSHRESHPRAKSSMTPKSGRSKCTALRVLSSPTQPTGWMQSDSSIDLILYSYIAHISFQVNRLMGFWYHGLVTIVVFSILSVPIPFPLAFGRVVLCNKEQTWEETTIWKFQRPIETCVATLNSSIVQVASLLIRRARWEEKRESSFALDVSHGRNQDDVMRVMGQ